MIENLLMECPLDFREVDGGVAFFVPNPPVHGGAPGDSLVAPPWRGGFDGVLKEEGEPESLGVLTARGRKQIKPSNFALPGRRYPIHDRAHARNALARVAQYGTPSEQARVRQAVKQKFPNIGG